jgi:hypothetical protein
MNTSKLDQLDLCTLAKLIRHDGARWDFLGAPGREHYRLLADLSQRRDHQILLDVGTFRGCSALALAYNETNTVVSFDLWNKVDLTRVPENIQFVVGDVMHDAYKELIAKSSLILLDTNHDGIFERRFFNHLLDLDWSGWLVLDDIYLNNAMRQFWSDIVLSKDDLTRIGHYTGTGLVYFTGDYTDGSRLSE